MLQIKIFKGIENELGTMEAQVNDWLRSSGARVVNIVGNIAPQSHSADGKSHGLSTSDFPPSDVLLIVLYDT